MPKNILLFMTDQQRPDYVGYVLNGRAVMPTLDRIAAHAHFTCCHTTNPICMPARTSLITGRYPRQIGSLTMSGDLFPQIPTFMQALQKQGYKTYGIGKFHYMQTYPWSTPRGCGMDMVAGAEETGKYGYDFIWETAGKQQLVSNYCFYADYLQQKGLLTQVRDFFRQSGGVNGDSPDHNYDQANPWPFDEEDYVDVVTARVACEQLAQHPADRPFYMKVSFCGPHKPYDAPQRYLDQFPLEREDDFILPDGQEITDAEKERLYRQRRSARAMLRLIDDQMGKILDTLEQRGLLDDTLILFTSDHGDMLGDHYRIQKGVPWHHSACVPLAAWLPGAAPVGENTSPVELSDIAATILDYAGLDPQQALSRDWPAYNNRIPCRSFLPVLRGEADRCRDFCFVESDFSEERGADTDPAAVLQSRGAGGRRGNAWQSIVTERVKYIKYLDYALGDDPYEELYDRTGDPDERVNRIDDPAYAEELRQARRRLCYLVDHYPAAQMTWATACAVDRRVY
ncbi:MAG: sulfatase [Intestinibacillus sp.]